jgi:hypothetical protein
MKYLKALVIASLLAIAMMETRDHVRAAQHPALATRNHVLVRRPQPYHAFASRVATMRQRIRGQIIAWRLARAERHHHPFWR